MIQTSTALRSENMPKWAFWLLVAYYFMEYCRPQNSMIPALSVLRLSGIIGVGLVFVLLTKSRVMQLFKVREIQYYLFFTLVLLLNIPFARNNYHAYDKTMTFVVFLFTAILPTIIVLLNAKYFERFIRIFGWIFLILAFVVLRNGGRGAGSFTWDENDAAAALCVGLSFTFYLSKLAPTSAKKLFWLFVSAVISFAVLVTASRGGFLGLIAVAFFVLYFSGRLLKGILYGVLVAILSYGALFFIPKGDYYRAEFASIFDKSDGTRNERFYSWEIAWIMYKHNPVIGVGANNYPYNVAHYESLHPEYDGNRKSLGGRWAHSLPFTIIAETGTLGTLFYFLCFWRVSRVCFKKGRQATSPVKGREALYYQMILAALAGYMVCSLFITTLYYPVVWHLVAIFVALECLSNESRFNEG